MHDHASSFVDGDDVFVFVKHIERNRLRFGPGRGPRMGLHGDEFPAAKFLGRFRGLAIDEEKAAVDEFLHAGARELRAMGRDKAVEASSSVSINRQKLMNLGLGSSRHALIVPSERVAGLGQ